MARKFTWLKWDIDFGGECYVIAKDLCDTADDVKQYVVKEDNLDPLCAKDMIVEDGWCKFQVRSDWSEHDGPAGWYVVERDKSCAHDVYGKRRSGWFPVWIIPVGEWY